MVDRTLVDTDGRANVGPGSRPSNRFGVVAWLLWYCGSTGLSAIVVSFVFSVYLTGRVGEGMPGGSSPASWLGRAQALAGLTIAVLAPLIGVWVVDSRRRRLALAVLTGLAVALTSAMSLIRDEPGYLWPGLALLAATAACTDLASVPYNAMLRQVSTPRTSGRISGFGFAAGDAGSVMLLLAATCSLFLEVAIRAGCLACRPKMVKTCERQWC
jgi:MFS transporter, UMF1 family